jgi:hypothetical protein
MSVPQAVLDADQRADSLSAGTPPDDQSSADAQPIPGDGVAPLGSDTGYVQPDAGDLTSRLDELSRRFDTLQGKYNAEVPRLHAENALLRSQLEQKTREAEAAASSVPKVSGQPVTSAQEPEVMAYIRKEMPDLEKAIMYIVGREIQAALPSFSSTINEVSKKVERVERTAATTAESAFKEALTAKVPNWIQINQDPDFSTWLSEVDRYSGMSKFDLLRAAYSQYNVNSVAAFFADFVEEKKARQSGASGNKGRFVNPPAGGPGAPPSNQNNQKRFTRAEVQKFYNDLNSNKYMGREDEAKRIEAEIDQAARLGLID